jgi:HAD superfamily hydrolase (TIGR01490 family)
VDFFNLPALQPPANLDVQLALFDLDHTLLDGDSDDLWFHFLAQQGALDKDRHAVQRARFSAEYREGKLQVSDFYAFVLKPLANHPVQQLRTWRKQFVCEHILSRITPEARALLDRHRDAGHKLAIITATNRFITEPIAAELQVTHLLATEPEFDGACFTGRVVGAPCFREGKLLHLREWLYNENFKPTETWFYSDSHNDLPLLESVDHPIAVNPDTQLSRLAQQRGWPVMQLRRKPDMVAY